MQQVLNEKITRMKIRADTNKATAVNTTRWTWCTQHTHFKAWFWSFTAICKVHKL